MSNDKFVQRLNLISIATAHGFSDGFHYVLVPILPLIIKDLGLSILQAGMIVSAQGLAVFLMLMPASMLSDYLGKRKFILSAGLILATLSFIGISRTGAAGYPLILALSFLVGLGNGTFHPTATALVSETFRNRPGFFMGVFSLGGNIGSALMPGLIGALALAMGWRSGLLVLMLPVLLLAVLLYRLLPEANLPRQAALSMLTGIRDKICRNLPVVTLIAIYSLRGIGCRGIITFFPLLIADSMGADARTAGFLMSAYFFLGALSKPLLGLFYDRFGVQRLLAILFLTGAVVVVVMTLTTRPLVMLLLMGLLGVATFISPIIMTAATSLVDESVRTSTVGMIYTAYEIQFLSPLVGGWIAQTYSLQTCYLFFAAILALGGGVSLLLKEKWLPVLKDI